MYMSDQADILPKWSSHLGIILAKGQLDHSFIFWTMPILIFSPVHLILKHPLSKICAILLFRLLWVLATRMDGTWIEIKVGIGPNFLAVALDIICSPYHMWHMMERFFLTKIHHRRWCFEFEISHATLIDSQCSQWVQSSRHALPAHFWGQKLTFL